MDAARLIAQVPTAFAATALFAVGGYPLVGWVSIGTCLVAAALASRFPEAPRLPDGDAAGEVRSFARTLWSGAGEALRRPGLRVVVLAAAVLGGLDGVEEYWPLMAGARGGARPPAPRPRPWP